MGCAQSRIENEEAVSRCKERRQLMKEAVNARNAFAAAHSAYAVALKNTGASLADFAHGEAQETPLPRHSSASASATAAATAAPAAGVHPPLDTLPPPPPPLPEFSPPPLQRSVSLPEIPKKYSSKVPRDASIQEEKEEEEDEEDVGKLERDHRRRLRSGTDASPSPSPTPPQPTPPPPPPMPESKGINAWDYFFTMDEHMPGPSLGHAEEIRPERDEAEVDEEVDAFKRSDPPLAEVVDPTHDDPPMTPEKVVLEPPLPPMPPGGKKQKQGGLAAHHQHAASAPPLDARRGKMVAAAAPGINLRQVLDEIDDHFLKASESAHDVSKMLEATRMHYHSNFADNRGHIDHSAIVMRVITWNRSFKGIPNAKDDFDNDEWETHATVLDKILAWEKKLYDEVKAGELMKIEYQRKVALLNRQKKRGAGIDALERTKAAVSHLHTRYIVDMQSMDSTVSEIQHLRDNQLYPKLVDLVDGMGKMWETMYMHHDAQLKIVSDLKALDTSNSPKETSEHHYKQTEQLGKIVEGWHLQFQKLVSHQKDYIKYLNSWLKLNLIPIESSLKEKVSSPPRLHQPPILALLHAWEDHLENLPVELAKTAISSFSAVINTIVTLQKEEHKQKEKCEETQKEYLRKSRDFEDWYHKYSQRKAASSEEAEPQGDEGANNKEPVTEKKFVVETLKSRLDDAVEEHKKLCKLVREKSLGCLKSHLPELFRAMSEFSHCCSGMYAELRLISQAQIPGTD